MNRVKIDFVISSLSRGGSENKLVAVANGLNRKKYNVTVCLLKQGLQVNPLAKKLEVKWIDSMIPTKYSILGFFRLAKHFRISKTRIVWVIGSGDAGFFGRVAAKLAGVPIVIQSLHATGRADGSTTIDPLNKLLDRAKFFTQKYIAVAKAHREYLLREEKLDPKKTTVIYNGASVEKFKPRIPDTALRCKMNIPDGVPVVGIVARFKPEKRHTLFLDACKLVKKKSQTAHFIIVGDGPLENEIIEHATNIGIIDNVHFSGGIDNVAPYYSLMSVSVLCSNTVETFPNVVIESLASGIPVISTDVGSVREAIIDEKTGLLVPQDDPVALADGIIRLITDTDLRNVVIAKGRQHVKDNFSLRIMIEKREELFGKLLAEKGLASKWDQE